MTVPFIFCAFNYSDQRNHKPRIFNSGGPRCERSCPYHGTLCLCAKHGLVIASAVPFLTGSTEWFQAIAWSMIIVQACDAFIGTTIKDRMKTFGPAGTALLNLVAVIWLIQAVP